MTCAQWERDTEEQTLGNLPWRKVTRDRVKNIVSHTRECRDDGANERTWRSLLEPYVYKGFKEVVSW
jgi:hypothetical protein